jgi:hypothetical protein
VRGRFTCAYSEQDESSQEVQETDGIRCVCLSVLCGQSSFWIIVIIATVGDFCSSLEAPCFDKTVQHRPVLVQDSIPFSVMCALQIFASCKKRGFDLLKCFADRAS